MKSTVENRVFLPLSGQLAYAVGQLGWSVVINLMNYRFVYFFNAPKEEKFPQFLDPSSIIWGLTPFILLFNIGRLTEIFTDPYFARFSDETQTRWGRRKPFLAFGSIPTALFCALTFFLPDNHPSFLNTIWLITTQILFFASFSSYAMPHNALLIELGHTEIQRLRLSMMISVAFALGIALTLCTDVFGVYLQEKFHISKVQSVQYAITGLCVFALACMLAPVILINEKVYANQELKVNQPPLFRSLKETFQNKKFQQFVISDGAYWAAMSIVEGGLLYFLIVLLGLKKEDMIFYFGIMIGSCFIFYIFMPPLTRKYSRKTLMQFAFVIFGILLGAVFFLGKIPINPQIQATIFMIIAAIPMSILAVLPTTVMADISDHDSLKTLQKKAAMFFAARTVMMKAGEIFGSQILAYLLIFGKDAGNDLGIRLSGLVGFGLCIIAYLIFRQYDEKGTADEIQEMKNKLS